MWAGCHKWKLQDINFMILTELKETVYSFERQGMNTIRLRVFVNPSDDKVSDTAARKKWLYGFA
jgi:arabinogalactan endo-1,4-beta-galactosidase